MTDNQKPALTYTETLALYQQAVGTTFSISMDPIEGENIRGEAAERPVGRPPVTMKLVRVEGSNHNKNRRADEHHGVHAWFTPTSAVYGDHVNGHCNHETVGDVLMLLSPVTDKKGELLYQMIIHAPQG